jgi:hypothetical protein
VKSDGTAAFVSSRASSGHARFVNQTFESPSIDGFLLGSGEVVSSSELLHSCSLFSLISKVWGVAPCPPAPARRRRCRPCFLPRMAPGPTHMAAPSRMAGQHPGRGPSPPHTGCPGAALTAGSLALQGAAGPLVVSPPTGRARSQPPMRFPAWRRWREEEDLFGKTPPVRNQNRTQEFTLV